MASEPQEKLGTCVARVRVTIEIDTGQPWGKECQLQQVYDQASREVVERLAKEFRPTDMRLIGKPVVTAILVTEQS